MFVNKQEPSFAHRCEKACAGRGSEGSFQPAVAQAVEVVWHVIVLCGSCAMYTCAGCWYWLSARLSLALFLSLYFFVLANPAAKAPQLFAMNHTRSLPGRSPRRAEGDPAKQDTMMVGLTPQE
ncbi:unnamed protein product, partial [Symbiodinium pilosum]